MTLSDSSPPASVRVRMAPSPTGYFHVGSARTALFNFLFARHHGGTFVLRVEDTDAARSDAAFEQVIYDGMAWLGLDVDEGPHRGGDLGPYRQSERFEIYRDYAQKLIAAGQAYPAYETREELDALKAEQERNKQAPRYNGAHRHLSQEQRAAYEAEGRKSVVRFVVPEGQSTWDDLVRGAVKWQNSEIDDWVILKSDGTPTYNFACAIDDALMQMTHVIRGEDGISNTPRQMMVYRALGWETPRFAHLPLLLGEDRSKMSKRHGSVNLLDYRDQGILPDAMFNYLALLGWNPGEGETQEIFSRDELIARFSLERVNKAGAIFDVKKLAAMNTDYLKAMPIEAFIELVRPALPGVNLDAHDAYVRQAVEMARERIQTHVDKEQVVNPDGKTETVSRFSLDLSGPTAYFFSDDFAVDPVGAAKHLTVATRPRLEALHAKLAGLTEWDHDSIEGAMRELAGELGVKAAELIHPARMAVSGRTVGPSIFELLAVLGRERVQHRLQVSLALGQ